MSHRALPCERTLYFPLSVSATLLMCGRRLRSVTRQILLWWGSLLVCACSSFGPDTQALIEQARQTGDHRAVVGEMIEVPAGEFVMGDDRSREPDERPAHPVSLAAFRLARHEVTRAQFLRFVEASGYHRRAPCWGWGEHGLRTESDWGWEHPGFPQDDTHPAACISWEDAQAYVQWLNRVLQPPRPYRLPSEAEWEYAARAGMHERFPWGDTMVDRQLNCWVCGDDFGHTSPVGSFPGNAFGLQDMSGNQWEWVQDCYVDNYNNASPAGATMRLAACRSRVVRGGSWGDNASFLRAAYRVPYLPGYRQQAFGFRLAQDRW